MKARRDFIALGLALLVGLLAWRCTNAYQLRVLFMMCVYYLCASGTNVLVGYAGQKSLGQAGMFAVGAYTVALATTLGGLDAWLALALACIVSAAFGVLLAMPSLRAKGPYLAMVTLAFGIVVEKICTEWSEVFGGAQGIYGIAVPTIAGRPLDEVQWVWLALALCLAVHCLLRNLLAGRFGRALLAVQGDEIAAGAAGIQVYRLKVLAFVIAAVTCGLGGALVAEQNQYINSDFVGFPLSVFILLVVLFGGAGWLLGPLIGTVLLVLIDASLTQWPHVQHFAYGALLLLALYAMPQGVAGLLARWWPARQELAPAETHSTVPVEEGGTTGILAQTSEELLRVASLSKAYGGIRPTQDVSFSVERGHIHALIGPNGAGKSTLINMVSGAVMPDEGRILFEGQDLVGLPTHAICSAGVGRTFQNLRLFPGLSVLEHVMLGRHSRMRNRFWGALLDLPEARRQEEEARCLAWSALRWLDLEAAAHLPATSLSYGLQRRVELARALAGQPRLLLLDEPAAGLNPMETAELADLLLLIRATGVSILMVEHHMDLVMRISDRITVLDHGVKIAEGPPEDIQTDPAVIAAYLGGELDEEVLPATHAAGVLHA